MLQEVELELAKRAEYTRGLIDGCMTYWNGYAGTQAHANDALEALLGDTHEHIKPPWEED